MQNVLITRTKKSIDTLYERIKREIYIHREKTKLLNLRYSVSDPNYVMLLGIRPCAKRVTQEGYIRP